MSDVGYHTPVEEYLEAIYAIAEEGTVVIAARLAERLNRTAASVSEMLVRLEADGYLERRGRAISLLPAGAHLATSVVRRHRLAERLLVDVIGLDWHKAHLEAGRWEHVISADVEARLVDLLGDPSTCPHGNPIPGSSRPVGMAGQALSSVVHGGRFRFVRIAESLETDDASLVAFEAAGALPGSDVDVEVGAGGTWSVHGALGTVEADAALASQLFVGPPTGF